MIEPHALMEALWHGFAWVLLPIILGSVLLMCLLSRCQRRIFRRWIARLEPRSRINILQTRAAYLDLSTAFQQKWLEKSRWVLLGVPLGFLLMGRLLPGILLVMAVPVWGLGIFGALVTLHLACIKEEWKIMRPFGMPNPGLQMPGGISFLILARAAVLAAAFLSGTVIIWRLCLPK